MSTIILNKNNFGNNINKLYDLMNKYGTVKVKYEVSEDDEDEKIFDSAVKDKRVKKLLNKLSEAL